MPLCTMCRVRVAERHRNRALRRANTLALPPTPNDPDLGHADEVSSTTPVPPTSPVREAEVVSRGRGRPKTVTDFKEAKRGYNRTYYQKVKAEREAKKLEALNPPKSQTIVI
jgi:hypothetical protein